MSQQVKCVACRNELDARATLCPVCKTYQGKWVRLFVFSGQSIGLITAVITALVFTASKLPDARRVLFPSDSIRVLGFESGRGLAVANTGDNPVLVMSVTSALKFIVTPTANTGPSRYETIFKSLGVGEVANYPGDADTSALLANRAAFSPPFTPAGDEAWKAGIQRASWTGGRPEASCVVWCVFAQRDPKFEYGLSIFRDVSRTPRTLEAELTVKWMSQRTRVVQTFSEPAIGLLYYKHLDPMCQILGAQ